MYLRIGSKGDLVRELQSKLKELGFDPGPIDGIFGNRTRKAVVKFQENKKLEAVGIVGPITLKALGIKAELPTPELERKQFRALLLKNPNYFGNIKISPFKPVKVITNNTSYEELKCIGYNPQLERLEAVVLIKKDYGYGGDICSSGTPEYVRFYVDWKNDGNWVDVGMVSFTAYDIPGDKPLEYAVTLQLDPKEKFCTIENLPKVRAILSWNSPPPGDEPDFVPVWGNTLEVQIQIDTLKFIPIGELLKVAKIKLPQDLLATLDLAQPVSTLKPQELSLSELKVIYQDKGIPTHRFGFSHVQKLLAKPTLTEELTKTGFAGVLAELDINISDLIDNLLKTDGDIRYEELKCVGLNPNQDTLTGVLTVKLPYGYSGDLCKKGSYEYVAFWEWDEIESMWLYLGTASVNVHDIKSIPKEGLQYSVFLPVDPTRHRRPCTKGASAVKIRAILSWEVPPPPDNPNWVPTWGNREETLIHIKPGPSVKPEEQIPYIESVGNMAVCDIDQTTGWATGVGIIAAFTANDSPFGGTITITGFITNPPNVMEGAPELKYKVFVRPYEPTKTDVENPWQPLSNKFTVTVTEQIGSNPPVQKHMEQKIDAEGYYTYLEDLHPPAWRFVAGRVLAKWVTGAPMSGLWEIRIEAKTPAGIVPGGVIVCPDGSTRSKVKVRLDNERPSADITITGYQRGSDPTVHPIGAGTPEKCGKFLIGDVIHGTYSVTDEHFGKLTLTVHPSGPAHGATVNPPERQYDIVPTTGESGTWMLDTSGMDPCGYIVRLWVRDRTIVDSGYIGWRNIDDVGFCLEEAPEEEEGE